MASAAGREFGVGFRAVGEEVRRWRRRAEAIPDPSLRADALHVLDKRRGHLDGAAMFWILPRRRDRSLLRALVAYELMQDYLDNVSERAAAVNGGDRCQLYLALADAVEPGRPLSDHYRGQPWSDDGGFLRELIETVRAESERLPSIETVRPRLVSDAPYAAVLAVNHLADPDRRDAALRGWVEANLPDEPDLRWYELAAAASGWITPHIQLALAAQPGVTREQSDATYGAYFPWCTLTLTMLDSYADQAEDAARGHHSYFGHYASGDEGVERLCMTIERAAEALLRLPDGERHGTLIACMIALYLSKDSARTPAMRETTRRIARAGGLLPRALTPVAHVWRICNAQRSAT
ncbi:MAG: tetraprenyl-beta-curcumene synthase family protein [Actinomycetota bacterium]|nr:tetraprenyl-beta-curcumene synthase family protein [Actinomycetota bacterium]